MKACSYCGRTNANEASHCAECATEFPAISTRVEAELPKRDDPAWRTRIDLKTLEGAFDFDEGFSRPDWELVRKHIKKTVDQLDWGTAWDEAAYQWLEQLQHDLGGTYRITGSENFFLLSTLDGTMADNIVRFAERARAVILENLRDVACQSPCREVILLFDEEDDYYTYIAHGYKDGEIPRSAGVFVRVGYPHVALTFHNGPDACHTIAHELTHGSLHGLPVPLWLEEGVCETLRRIIGGPRTAPGEGPVAEYWGAVSGWKPPLMWDELAERHHAFWDEKNIQSFWAGTSFNGPEESQQLSYSLAEVLTNLLSGDHQGFLAFLGRAHYDDAGQTAALECLGMNLGEVVTNFLGEGDWRPYRKAIVECWTARETPHPDDSGALE